MNASKIPFFSDTEPVILTWLTSPHPLSSTTTTVHATTGTNKLQKKVSSISTPDKTLSKNSNKRTSQSRYNTFQEKSTALMFSPRNSVTAPTSGHSGTRSCALVILPSASNNILTSETCTANYQLHRPATISSQSSKTVGETKQFLTFPPIATFPVPDFIYTQISPQ